MARALTIKNYLRESQLFMARSVVALVSVALLTCLLVGRLIVFVANRAEVGCSGAPWETFTVRPWIFDHGSPQFTDRIRRSDLVDRLVAHAPYLTREDFFPVPTVAPLSNLIGALSGSPKLTFTCHSHCGLAAFLYISEDGDRRDV